ncbi:unnamed protein product [Nippostrongylus brasiliensis]|uniref:BPTI/Kunitz inhibitor domain-containing protein n=1 Tax=Nippostrongylus brasiliensis TaxID=27835 RepID=A0A0N4XSW6_NIPBR|nr:unnamed protein product [Nippostrongylus brasiliensis]
MPVTSLLVFLAETSFRVEMYINGVKRGVIIEKKQLDKEQVNGNDVEREQANHDFISTMKGREHNLDEHGNEKRISVKDEDEKNSVVKHPRFTVDLPKPMEATKSRVRTHELRPWLLTDTKEEEQHQTSEGTFTGSVNEIKVAGDRKFPMDEKRIRKLLRRNKKLMRALIEAYKLRSTTSLPTTADTQSTEDTITNGSTPAVEEDVHEQLRVDQRDVPVSVELIPMGNNESSTDFSQPQEVESDEHQDVDDTGHFSGNVENESTSEDSTKDIGPMNSAAENTSSTTVTLNLLDNLDEYQKTTTTTTAAVPDFDDQRASMSADSDYGPPGNLTGQVDLLETMNSSNSDGTIEQTIGTTTNGKDVLASTQVLTTEISSPPSSNGYEEVSSTTSTTTQLPYWPKKGYVPNTRKHASEITSKLYMTQEIFQALSDDPIRRSSILKLDCLENRRCCKITRTECPDGSTPKYVTRYYRPRGSDTCAPYNYPRCSQGDEMDEQPIQYEQNCQDLCFRGPEKHISPLFQLAIET